MICMFIDVAIEMHDLRNFAGLSSVITALCIDMVARLRQSWALVPQAMVDRLQVRERPTASTTPPPRLSHRVPIHAQPRVNPAHGTVVNSPNCTAWR
jgi:hypothetical protein